MSSLLKYNIVIYIVGNAAESDADEVDEQFENIMVCILLFNNSIKCICIA